MAGITLAEIELFFVDEAALLDEWRLEEWLALFAEDGRYLVPSLDQPHSDHRTALFLIADDRKTLASRVRQLLGGQTWAENPRSRTRRLITNFRILDKGSAALPPRPTLRSGAFSTRRPTSMSVATSMCSCAPAPA